MTRIAVEVYRNTSTLQVSGKNESIYEKTNIQHLGGDSMEKNNHRLEWFDAARSGEVDDIKRLLRLGADVNWKNEHKSTALHEAASNGHTDVLQLLLLHHDAEVDAKDEGQNTTLYKAASKGHTAAVLLLLECGAAVDARNEDSKTALYEAARYGHKDVVRLLLNYDAAVDAVTDDLHTALHWASFFGHEEIVQLLLDSGALVDAKDQYFDTALNMAAMNGHQEVVHLLLQNNATVDLKDIHSCTALYYAANDGHKEVVHMLLVHGAAVDTRNSNLESALHKAALFGYHEVARLLLNHGASVDAKDQDLNTALHKAALTGKEDVARLLLDHGAEVDSENVKLDTALHEAARYGHKGVVKLLIANGASVKQKHNDKKPILTEVSELGDVRMAQLLLHYGADIEAPDSEGQTVFIIAAKANQLNMVSLLINERCNIEATDNDSLTALHWSAKEGNVNVLKLLLQKGAHIEAATKHGITALHLAAEFNHIDILSTLLKHGAKIDAENERKHTPIQEAISRGHIEIVYHLKNAGASLTGNEDSNLRLLYQATDAGQVELVSRALDECSNANERLYLMNATLRRASEAGKINIVSYLLDSGADIEDVNDDGYTPLFLAGQHPEMVSLLVHRGAYMEARNLKNRNQCVLHYFASLSQFDSLRILLHCECNIHLVDKGNNTVLHYASYTGEREVASLLLHHGVDINAKNKNGESVLHIAVECGFYDLTDLLIDKGIDINSKNLSVKETALHIATKNHNSKLVSLLLRKHVDVDATDVTEKTALHIAVINHLTEECALIIKHSANVNMMDERHWTPLCYAMASCDPDLVNLLLDNGAFVHKSDHGRVLLSRIIDSATLQEGYYLWHRSDAVVTSIIRAGTDTTGINFTEEFKRKFPAVVDALNKSSQRSINKDTVNLNPPFAALQEHAVKIEQTDVILKEYRGNTDNQHESFRCKEKRLVDIKHKYGRGFPLSKHLHLEEFQIEDGATRYQHIAAKDILKSKSLKLFDAISLSKRATTLVTSLFDCFGVELFISDGFYILESTRCVEKKPPEWASHFDKMLGIIREPGRLILQIPSKNTIFSIKEWYESAHPYLRFINAVYVCRRSSKNLNQDVFSTFLGGSEQMLAINLHAIFIAGLSILSIVGGDGLVEKLVMAILDIKLPSIQTSPNDIFIDWQVRNRRQCPCNSDSVHRPLSPVAAAKAVGIDIWRERHEQVVYRVWDLRQDKLVQNIKATEVIFITHRWNIGEVVYQHVEKVKRWKNRSISRRSEKLYRIRKALLKHTNYVWIDTICIDKSNLSELDEAIRSMYKWYSSSAAVILDSGTPLNVWCKRGWCLQEGAAAGVLYGISKEGKLVTIQELAVEQHQSLCTLDLHLYYRPGNAAEILTRMNMRDTQRVEDVVYALIGMFSIHLELAYGEGTKSRERLLRELATQKGDLSFLSFQTTQKISHCLPTIGEPNYLMAKCTKALTQISVSHMGICLEVQLIKGQEISRVLHKLRSWRNMSFAKGRFLGVDELVEAAEKFIHQNTTSIELAVLHHISSLMLVETYNEELQTSGRRPTKQRYRLQCCQIEEKEFQRLFGKNDAAEDEKIWLGNQPDGAEVD